MPRNGPEGQPRLNLDKDIKLLAWAKALNIPPVILNAYSPDMATQLGFKIDTVDRHGLSAKVTAMADEITANFAKKGGMPATIEEAIAILTEKFTPSNIVQELKKPKSRARKKPQIGISSIPQQMGLQKAHPGGWEGFYGPLVIHEMVRDPEQGINAMHYRKRLFNSHILIKDADHEWRTWWRNFLKSIGYTRAEINARLHIAAQEAVIRLQEAGLWYLVEKKGNWSREEIELLRSATKLDPYENV